MPYRKQLILKTVVTIDGELLQVAAQRKLYVLSAVPWRSITPTIIKNFFVKGGFLIDHVSSNDGSAANLTEVEENDWHSEQALVLQSEDYSTCDSTLKVCGLLNINQVIDQHLTRPEDEPVEEEEVVEHKAIFLDALKGVKAARRYIISFIPRALLL
jgi:hypothetical protein